ncbi:MAG: hypothetical protein U1U88_001618 [Lawsonella clevelandensis]
MVEADDVLEEHEVEVTEALVVCAVQMEGWFVDGEEVVGEVADEAAGERRQFRQARTVMFGDEAGDDVAGQLRSGGGLVFVAEGGNGDGAVLRGDGEGGLVAEEGVAAAVVRVAQGFQQEDVGNSVP